MPRQSHSKLRLETIGSSLTASTYVKQPSARVLQSMVFFPVVNDFSPCRRQPYTHPVYVSMACTPPGLGKVRLTQGPFILPLQDVSPATLQPDADGCCGLLRCGSFNTKQGFIVARSLMFGVIHRVGERESTRVLATAYMRSAFLLFSTCYVAGQDCDDFQNSTVNYLFLPNQKLCAILRYDRLSTAGPAGLCLFSKLHKSWTSLNNACHTVACPPLASMPSAPSSVLHSLSESLCQILLYLPLYNRGFCRVFFDLSTSDRREQAGSANTGVVGLSVRVSATINKLKY